MIRPAPTNYRHYGTALYEPRRGIMVHYDASSSDAGALFWLTQSPTAKVSYHVLITRDGVAHGIAPLDARAWHAGVCRPTGTSPLRYTDANSAFYGVAIAATDGDRATPAQVAAVIAVCRLLAARHQWDLGAQPWRIVGHDTEAWPRGRKKDPTGSDPSRPVLDVAAIRAAFTPPPPALAAA